MTSVCMHTSEELMQELAAEHAVECLTTLPMEPWPPLPAEPPPPLPVEAEQQQAAREAAATEAARLAVSKSKASTSRAKQRIEEALALMRSQKLDARAVENELSCVRNQHSRSLSRQTAASSMNPSRSRLSSRMRSLSTRRPQTRDEGKSKKKERVSRRSSSSRSSRSSMSSSSNSRHSKHKNAEEDARAAAYHAQWVQYQSAAHAHYMLYEAAATAHRRYQAAMSYQYQKSVRDYERAPHLASHGAPSRRFKCKSKMTSKHSKSPERSIDNKLARSDRDPSATINRRKSRSVERWEPGVSPSRSRSPKFSRISSRSLSRPLVCAADVTSEVLDDCRPDISPAELLEKVLSQLPDPVECKATGIAEGSHKDLERGHAMVMGKKAAAKGKAKAKAKSVTKVKRNTKSSAVSLRARRTSQAKPTAMALKARRNSGAKPGSEPIEVSLRAPCLPQAEAVEEEPRHQTPAIPDGKIFAKAVSSLAPKAVCLRRRCSLGGA